jgi:hypothetical protein
MSTYIVLANIWNEDFTDTVKATVEVKADSRVDAIDDVAKREYVKYVSDAWAKEDETNKQS